ncbi:DM13 domain-containing protein [Tamlana sp. 2_MG-2023]|uniref:DM13 domain-containing protein n=1 Tax=unclassified Tamlana TaxID=2614803 RepID=UPI0026E1C67A|nr:MULTISPECIES: DM13 domain-containing protein [unclassified Tamlana]MDO6759197.1 DM13 domain-containing protein [Tamlana sp. 2_MG-2023]MDO6790664.1 DM13 domain-containing protein [Tamlana sp. 1_MG-2023]
MKTYFLLFLSVICFTACSSDNDDSPMDTTDDDVMESTYSGTFVSVAHPTEGTAFVNEDKTTLKLSNFKSDDGPLLELYLTTDETAKEFITLGGLKGLDGNYEYTLPENVDLSIYKYVMVWCVDFDVNFGHAILKMD